jgi:hypothetical protein
VYLEVLDELPGEDSKKYGVFVFPAAGDVIDII